MKETRFRKPDFQQKLAKARGYRRKTEPVQAFGLGSRFALVSLAIFVIAVFYFLAVSKAFLVKNAAVAGDALPAEDMQAVLADMQSDRIWQVIPRNHIAVMLKSDLLEALQKRQPQVRSITSFKKVFPDIVQLGIEVRKPLYVWQSGADFYLLDQDGVAFEKFSTYSPDIYSEILITDRTAEPLTEGKLEIKKILAFIESVRAKWPQKISQTPFVNFSVPGSSSLDIFARTGIGFEVYFDIERSVERQIDNLALLLNREIKPETYAGLSYIDLRLPTAAYYCYKDAPCAVENQK